MREKYDMKKIEIQQRQRLLDGFFKVDEITLRHELADGRMSPPLRRLNLDRGKGVAALLYNRTTQKIVLCGSSGTRPRSKVRAGFWK